MSDPKSVIRALAPLGKPAKAFVHPVGVKLVAATRQNLVPVGLMPNVPDYLVFGRIEDIMLGNSQLHNAQAGTKVAPLFTDDIDDELSQLIANLL